LICYLSLGVIIKMNWNWLENNSRI
jgi:hypothetical protein